VEETVLNISGKFKKPLKLLGSGKIYPFHCRTDAQSILPVLDSTRKTSLSCGRKLKKINPCQGWTVEQTILTFGG
jgi:hypothetical protein